MVVIPERVEHKVKHKVKANELKYKSVMTNIGCFTFNAETNSEHVYKAIERVRRILS